MTRTLRLAPLVMLLCVSTWAQEKAVPEPEWAKAKEEMAGFLRDLVRIDTSNPPGNETRAALYIKGVLDREGVPSEIIEKVPGRGNLVARLKGNGKKRPLLLLAHLDVVGVERDKWTVDPFAAVVRDGYIYGRGAADDKNIIAAELEVFLLLHRLKAPLDRDVILLADAGEEGTPGYGIDFLIEKHWDKIACEFAINEGPNMREGQGQVRWVGIATTEKVPRPMRLVAHGTSGHGSMPRIDNPVTHLAVAVGRLGQWNTPVRLNPTTREFFDRLAKISPPGEAQLFRNLEDPGVQEKLLVKYPDYFSMLHTSIVPTIIKGGFRENVIPAMAEATVDIRALPDEDIPALFARIKQLINDPAIEIIPGEETLRPVAPVSRTDTEMFRAFEAAQEKVFPGTATLPVQPPFATDMAELRAKGVQAYGVGPPAPPTGEGGGPRMHGNDERISIEGMGKYLEFLYWAVKQVAAGP